MNSLCVFLVLVFSSTLALPAKNGLVLQELLSKTGKLGRNSVLENALIGALEDFRQTMVTGSDDIPVLDPFNQDRIFLDDSLIPVPGAHLEVNDLTVSQLSTFELMHVSITRTSLLLQRYNVIVDVEVPEIQVDVDNYDLSLNFNGIHLFGNGDAKIVIIKPRVKLEVLVGLRPRLGIYLNVLSTRIDLSIADIQPEIRGIFNNPLVDNFVNLFLKNLVLEILDTFSEQITDVISPLVQDIANEVLDDINFINIFG